MRLLCWCLRLSRNTYIFSILSLGWKMLIYLLLVVIQELPKISLLESLTLLSTPFIHWKLRIIDRSYKCRLSIQTDVKCCILKLFLVTLDNKTMMIICQDCWNGSIIIKIIKSLWRRCILETIIYLNIQCCTL